MFKNIYLHILSLWKQDVNGSTLNEFTGYSNFSKAHPLMAKVVNYSLAIFRLFFYWFCFGLVTAVAPVLGIAALIWYKALWYYIVAFAIPAGLWYWFIIAPYFISMAKGTYKDQ